MSEPIEILDGLNPLERLSRDVVKASKLLSLQEIRYLVDSYYSLQEYRKATANQQLALSKSEEPPEVIIWLRQQTETLEGQIKRVLDKWTDSHPTSAWAKSITGIGPVISAGLAAHIDIKQAPTAGHIWSFAGLNPTTEWLGDAKTRTLWEAALTAEDDNLLDAFLWMCKATSHKPLAVLKTCGYEFLEVTRPVIDVLFVSAFGIDTSATKTLAYMHPENIINELSAAHNVKSKAVYRVLLADLDIKRKDLDKYFCKRPWNASLKTLCWKIGESFVKVSGNEYDVYGKLYLKRKDEEMQRNEAGALAEQAAAKLEKFKIGKATDAYKAYSSGKLPPAHIHSRAKRYAVKMFLSHYHAVAWELQMGTKPPKPWVHEFGGHAHYIAPPNWPMK